MNKIDVQQNSIFSDIVLRKIWNIVKIVAILFISDFELYAFSSVMNHRLVTSSPLLYKQIDYTYENLSIEFEPLVSGAFDLEHIIANLTPGGKMNLTFDQQGNGDVNPAWIYLESPLTEGAVVGNYASTVTFTPTQQLYGLLFHCYKQFEHLFFDLKTSLLKCTNEIAINEIGGGNGLLDNHNGEVIYNAYDAFTQDYFEYGKIGRSNPLIGFDNIQLFLGASTYVDTMKSDQFQTCCAGFAVIEVPTGAGTKSEWLFEPQVGTNHWGLGFGADLMFVNDNNFSFVFGGNFRHYIANWETRTFDLINNGAWSRYLLLESLDNIENGLTVGAVSISTQDALIQGRNQINMYGRLQKRFEGCLFELSYNLFYDEAESIKRVSVITPGYGIYDLISAGGVTTASTAKINEANLVQDNIPVQLVTSDLDFSSGAAGQILNNAIAARLQRVQEFYTYGIGVQVDLAHTAQGISNWSIWANFEILLP